MRWRWLQMADPIHGLLQFDRKDPVHRILLETMNSLAFQRLRRVKQMGMAEFVFPGAVHTRFSHSLGATFLMSQAMTHFKYDRPSREILKSTFQDTGISLETLLMTGILVHDIGHPPLSHTLEDVLGLHVEGLTHDHYWLPRILKEDEQLQSIWKTFGVDNIADAMNTFMIGTETEPRHYLAGLVASQLDMDRLDYLLRDSHFMGTRYGEIECDRLISCLEIQNKLDGKPVITLLEDGLPALEHYLFGRHQAYKMALHSIDKASEALLGFTLQRFMWAIRNGISTGNPAKELFQLGDNGKSMSIQSYLRMDDHYLWNAIQDWSLESQDPFLKELASRLMRHNLPKFIDLMELRYYPSVDEQDELQTDLEKHYAERGIPFEYGFSETWVEPKPLYRQDKEPLWLETRDRGIVELPVLSPLAQQFEAKHMAKHLWFVWDHEARKFLAERLNKLTPQKMDDFN
jgi:HD superfamily phosphohydrolase